MRQFTYTVKSPAGLGTRLAGLLAKLGGNYPDTVITVTKDGETAKTSQPMRLIRMGIRQGDQVTVAADGSLQDRAIVTARAFFEERL